MLPFGISDRLKTGSSALFGTKGVSQDRQYTDITPETKTEKALEFGGEIVGSILPFGAAGTALKAGGKAVVPPVARALKEIAAKAPTVAKKGAGIGAAVTGYETIKGATEKDYAKERDTLPSKAGASLRAGTGALLSNIGYGAMRAGKDERAEKLIKKGEKISEGFTLDRKEYQGWKSWLDPDFYVINVAQTVPMTAALIPPMLASYKAFGAAATKRGFDPFLKAIIASLGTSVVVRPLEASMGTPVGRNGAVNELVEKVLYNSYDERIQRFLLRLSVMDSFTVEQALFVTQEEESEETLKKLRR